jgi:hypothetical protein
MAVKKLFLMAASISAEAVKILWAKLLAIAGPLLAWLIEQFKAFAEWLQSLIEAFGGPELLEAFADFLHTLKVLVQKSALAAKKHAETLMAEISKSFKNMKAELRTGWDEFIKLLVYVYATLQSSFEEASSGRLLTH